MLTYTKEGKASRLNFKNLIIGLANTSFSDTINDLLSRVATLEVGLSTLTSTVSTMNTLLSSQIASNTSRISALETAVSTNNNTLSGQIAAINATLSNYGNRISALESSVSGLSTLDVAGMVISISGNTIPTGWLPCDGRALNRVTYARLFTAIGTLYGGGDGTTTFNIPNCNGRMIVQQDNGAGNVPNINIASIGGEWRHLLTKEEMPNHTHDILLTDSPNRRIYNAEGGNDWFGLDPRSFAPGDVDNLVPQQAANWNYHNSSTGGGQAHNNMPPYITMQFIIRT